MIDSPLMVDGKVILSPPGTPAWSDDDSVVASDDVPIRPLLPELDWGFAPYTERLAAYSPAPLPLPVSLLAIAAEFDGRVWLGLSDNSALQETHGVHFDLVTRRIDELADRYKVLAMRGRVRRLEGASSPHRDGPRRNFCRRFEQAGIATIACSEPSRQSSRARNEQQRNPCFAYWPSEKQISFSPPETVFQLCTQMRQPARVRRGAATCAWAVSCRMTRRRAAR